MWACVCVFVCADVCICVHVCMYVISCICVYVCLYTYTCAHHISPNALRRHCISVHFWVCVFVYLYDCDSLVLVCVQQSCVAMCTCPPWVCVCEQQVPITTVSEELDRYPRCSFWNCSCWLLVHMRTVCGSPGLYLCTHRGEVVCLQLCFYMLLGGPRNVNLLVMSQKLLRVCHFMFHLLCQLDTKLLYIV